MCVYTEPYQIEDAIQLLLLTELADYYCALRILSRTLDGAMINSPNFCSSIRAKALDLFVAAGKLRNALLFRECLIWVVGPNQNPVYLELKAGDRNIRQVAKHAHGDISIKLAKVQQRLWRYAGIDFRDNWRDNWENHLFSNLGYCGEVDEDPENRFPVEFPWLLRYIISANPEILDEGSCEGLLRSSIVLEKGVYEAGKENCEDNFLCAEVTDEDLPWDVNETDW